MTALGKFSDSNLALTATLSGGVTAAAPLDLSALKLERDYVYTPCRFPDCTSLTKTQFSAVLAEPRLVSMVALLFHTMSLGAKYRIRASSEDAKAMLVVKSADLRADGASWSTSSATITDLGAGPYGRRVRVASTGATWHRIGTYNNAVSPVLTAGQAYGVTVLYEAGTSGWAYMEIRNNLGNAGASMRGKVGALTPSSTGAGVYSNVVQDQPVPGLYRFRATFTPNFSGPTSASGVGPGSDVVGEDIVAIGFQIEAGAVSSFYPTAPGDMTRPAGYIDSWQSYDLDTGWTDVFPSIFDPADLEWGVDNWLTGTVSQAELDLYPRNLFASLPEIIATGLKVELDDRANPAGFFDVGGLQIVSGWSPTINFARGRELTVLPRDLVDEAPSGRRFAEERTPRRRLAVTYDMLSDAEARRWLDAAMRARTTRTVLFVPDTDDPASMMREAFPATFGTLPGPKFTYSGLNSTGAVFEEILA